LFGHGRYLPRPGNGGIAGNSRWADMLLGAFTAYLLERPISAISPGIQGSALSSAWLAMI